MRWLAMFLAIIPSTAFTQTTLQAKIAAIAQDAQGTVSVVFSPAPGSTAI
jgi:hypothetical protein